MWNRTEAKTRKPIGIETGAGWNFEDNKCLDNASFVVVMFTYLSTKRVNQSVSRRGWICQ